MADIIEQKVARGEIHLSEMGWKMLAARRKIEQSGIPLLTREESERELAERRGYDYDDVLDDESPHTPEAQQGPSAADLVEEMAARGEIEISEMGRRLLAARREIERSGIRLFNREELDRELARRRGC